MWGKEQKPIVYKLGAWDELHGRLQADADDEHYLLSTRVSANNTT